MDNALAVRQQPQSTGMGLWQQAPNQNALAATVVPLDRENLTFFANMIKSAGLIPQGKEPESVMFSRVMSRIVAGTSYGFDPILSQQCFDVVFNQLGLNANGKGILFRESGEFDLRFVYHTEEGCKVKVLRLIEGKWCEIGEVEFNKAMAEQAGLLTGPMKDMWRKYPRDMYYARVITRAVKRFNPSCVKPKLILGNVFAKESQPALPPPPAPPAETELLGAGHDSEHLNGVATEGAEYVDAEYQEPATSGAADDDEELPGEVTVTTEAVEDEDESPDAEKSDDSKVEDLRIACKDLINELTGGEARKVQELLNGRVLSNMNLPQLTKFYDELSSKQGG